MLMTETPPLQQEQIPTVTDAPVAAVFGIDPEEPYIMRGDGVKYVWFRGLEFQYTDDGTFDVPPGFWALAENS